MTSLPMSNCWTEPAVAALPTGLSGLVTGQPSLGQPSVLGQPSIQDEQFLLRAFRSFAEAAGSLEHSYGMLRTEVERLRRELETSHANLAQSVEENRSMREYLDRILEGLPCGVIVAGCDGRISRMNPEALRLLGNKSTSTDDGTPLLTSLANLPGGIHELLESASTQAGEPETRLSGDDGTVRWLAARHASIRDHAENASVFILRDVSERKHLEEAQAELRREQALAEMCAILAHEIRNPLGSLELFAGLLAEADLDSDCRNWVEHIQAGLRTLAATVNNVLHFHSLPEPERSPVDLGQLLVWARDFFLPLARQSRVVMSLQNLVSGVFLPADRHRLEQLLLNLVLNALRAMPDGGWIELGGRTIDTGDGKAVVLVVSDTGPGIAPEHLPSVFDAGFSTRAGSPGLGLAVCRKIVAQHGGTITVGSRPGCGAQFTLTFPLESPPTFLPMNRMDRPDDNPIASANILRDPLLNGPSMNLLTEGVAE